jgi:hypothetical protein
MTPDPHPAFTQAMFQIYRRAKDEAGYTANIFLDMITRNHGLATAKTLINAAQPSDGYTNLFQRDRLDLTVEAVVVESLRWRNLFTAEELARAENRLRQYNYTPRAPS